MIPGEVPPTLDRTTLRQATLYLTQRDADLARVVNRLGIPPLWKRPATMGTLVRIVIEQQVSLAVAKVIYERLRLSCQGTITAKSLLLHDETALRTIGLSRQKARYVRELALAIAQRRFSLQRLRQLPDDDAAIAIRSLLGFGLWSADIYLIMALLRPDRLPIGDLGLIKGMEEVCDMPFPTVEEMHNRAERWRPYRSVATRIVWHSYLANRGKDAHAIASG